MQQIVNDSYEEGMPSNETMLSLFEGEWVCRLPGTEIGVIPLVDDPRMHWALEKGGPWEGKRAVELGPLEAMHTYLLTRAGASVTAIEANARYFLKCLIVKEIYSLDKAKFLFGNFVPWLEASEDHFDYIHCAGVLYHMVDPVGLLDQVCRLSDSLYIWTHYADMKHMPADDPRYVGGIIGVEQGNAHGKDFRMYRRRYITDPTTDAKFCGGVHKNPVWLEKDFILHVLSSNGFSYEVSFDEPNHQNGPCMSVFAKRI